MWTTVASTKRSYTQQSQNSWRNQPPRYQRHSKPQSDQFLRLHQEIKQAWNDNSTVRREQGRNGKSIKKGPIQFSKWLIFLNLWTSFQKILWRRTKVDPAAVSLITHSCSMTSWTGAVNVWNSFWIWRKLSQNATGGKQNATLK